MPDTVALAGIGCSLIKVPTRSDERGILQFAEHGDPLPFSPARAFWISGVNPDRPRGGHAHRRCQQFLIPLVGSVEVTLRAKGGDITQLLHAGEWGLYMPQMVFCDLRFASTHTLLLVLASEPYDAGDYITDVQQLLFG